MLMMNSLIPVPTLALLKIKMCSIVLLSCFKSSNDY